MSGFCGWKFCWWRYDPICPQKLGFTKHRSSTKSPLWVMGFPFQRYMLFALCPMDDYIIKSLVVQGTIQWDPFWGNQTMRTYGNFDRSHRKKNEVWDDVIEWALVLCCSWNNLVPASVVWQFCWAWSADILGGFKWHLPMWVTAFNDLELGWLGRTSCCVFFATSKWIKVMRIKGRDSFPFKRRSWKKMGVP